MSEFTISQITKKGVDSVAHLLAPEIVSTIKEGLPVTALAVVEDGTVTGALGGAIDKDTFEIVSIYVSQDSRRKGAGTALMRKLFELADKEDLMVRAEYTPIDSEGRTLKPFFTSLGFRQESLFFPVYCADEIGNFRLDSRSLPGSMSRIMSFAEAPQKLLAEAVRNREKKDDMIGELKGFMELIDRNISFLIIEKDELTSCTMAERIGEKVIQITPIWSENTDPKDMKMMIAYVLDEVRGKCAPDTCITIPALDMKTLQIIDEICSTSAAVTLSFVKNSFAEII